VDETSVAVPGVITTVRIDGSTQIKTNGLVDLPPYPTKISLGLNNVGNYIALRADGEEQNISVDTA
jgi:hypothetical protein